MAGGHYSWTGGNRGVGNPPTVTPPHDDWQLNTDGEPAGHLTAATWSGTTGVGLHVLGNSPSNASWFYTVASVPEVTDTDFLWQKQTRTFTEGVDCPTPPECPNGDFNGDQDGCGTPPEECPNGDFNGDQDGCGTPPVEKKIVVCKYVGTPPGVLDHIVIVSENTLNNLVDDNGNPFTGQFPFSWTDAQGQTTEGSKAIRYATDGEQAKDVALSVCGETPPECPNGDFNGDEDGCGTPPEECPDGDFNGDEPGCGEPNPGPDTCPLDSDKPGAEIPEGDDPEEFCNEDDEENVCPEDSDNAGDVIPDGQTEEEVCDEDDDVDPGPNCEEDPTQPSCDEDKPPVVNPDDGNSPSNGPTVKGASATAPTAAAGHGCRNSGSPGAHRRQRRTGIHPAGAGGQRRNAGSPRDRDGAHRRRPGRPDLSPEAADRCGPPREDVT